MNDSILIGFMVLRFLIQRTYMHTPQTNQNNSKRTSDLFMRRHL
jgi:hypothetical protein